MGGKGSGSGKAGPGRPRKHCAFLKTAMAVQYEKRQRAIAMEEQGYRLQTRYGDVFDNIAVANGRGEKLEIDAEAGTNPMRRPWSRDRDDRPRRTLSTAARKKVVDFVREFEDLMRSESWNAHISDDPRILRAKSIMDEWSTTLAEGEAMCEAVEALASNLRLLRGVDGRPPQLSTIPSGRRMAARRPKGTSQAIIDDVIAYMAMTYGVTVNRRDIESSVREHRKQFPDADDSPEDR